MLLPQTPKGALTVYILKFLFQSPFRGLGHTEGSRKNIIFAL